MDELTIGERIDHYMKRYGMKQEELAKRLGIGVSTLRRYRLDPSEMKYGTIKKLCELFKIPVEKLLEGR